MASYTQFIEIKRVTKDKSGSNVVRNETIKIADIKSFRPWFKTAKEDYIKGELTMLILENNASVNTESEPLEKEKEPVEKEKRNTLLVSESYNDFVTRMRSFVIIK